MSANPKSQARSAARLGAVQALYQYTMEGTQIAFLLHEFHQHRLGGEADPEVEDSQLADAEQAFFDDLVRGTIARLEEIDGLIEGRLAEGWALARLDRTMLQILRVGTYELLARNDVPKASVISEYVDVAHAFFDAREAKFVNGLLDAIARQVRG